jgi:serine phosphatase RsbU (regulator of sigma subunit)/anti-sigma regulatory factor (Ser/Thr protein kinase)/anti-anti-sigma regulatory factor
VSAGAAPRGREDDPRRRSDQSATDRELRRAQELLVALQRALLPSSVPLLPRADVAASYLVAGDGQVAGGDWFEALTVPDGRLALIVGDVVGHDITSSAVMSQLRAVLAARLLEGAGLTASFAALEAFASRVSGAFAATVCAALFDPETGALEYATRGHPAPLIARAGETQLLPTTGDGPLGSRARGAVATAQVGPDELVVLYTDGLVERPGTRLDARMAELRQAVQDALAGSVSSDAMSVSCALRVCLHVPAAMTSENLLDDVTVLVAQRRQPPHALHLDLEAHPSSLAQVRAALDGWAIQVGLAKQDRAALILGASELAANAVEHAYRDQEPGTFELDATLRDDAIVAVTITDHGTWKEPDAHLAERGRGFAMTAAAGLRLVIETDRTGTRVSLEAPARRPTPVPDVHTSHEEAVAGGPHPLHVATDEPGVVRAFGPVDHTAPAEKLAVEVRRASREGLLPVELDLSGVTFIGSAGVRALEAARAELGDEAVQIVTGPDSVVAQTLSLTGTPHSVR